MTKLKFCTGDIIHYPAVEHDDYPNDEAYYLITQINYNGEESTYNCINLYTGESSDFYVTSFRERHSYVAA